MEEPIYIKIDSPLTLRKELLQTNIQIVETLKKREEVIEKIEGKNKIRNELIRQIGSLNHLTSKLNRQLPKHKPKKKPIPKPKPLNIKGVKIPKLPHKTKKEVEIETPYSDQLEKELLELKAKLSAL